MKIKEQIFLFLITLLITSCHLREQSMSFGKVFSPASNGDVAETFNRMEDTNKFKNLILNRKFKATKKAYQARFIDKDEKEKAPSKNTIINAICDIYHDYWDLKLLKSPLKVDSLLYDNIGHFLVNKKLTKFTYDQLRPTIKDDKELSKVIKEQGFHSRFLYLNGIQDLLIWEKQDTHFYKISLPEEELKIKVVFIQDYVNRGCIDYATFGMAEIGGWASSDSPSLFCNKGTYKLNSESFKISYLKHEALHFVDMKAYPNLNSAELEYRSKLVELMYSSKKTIYNLLANFIIGGSNETRANSHAYANYYIHHHFSKELFNIDFENDLNKWRKVPVERINQASTKLYYECTKKLKENPALKHII